MIYLDNAATSWPKPPGVAEAMAACLRDAGANPGRSGHAMAQRTADLVMDCREALAALLEVSNPLRIAFMPNATTALNTAIKGMVRPGGHVVTTALEHNAVMRPLNALEARGVTVTTICGPGGVASPDAVLDALRPETQLVVMTHASNVTGAFNPVEETAGLLRARGVPLLVDAAQSIGSVPALPEVWGIDMLAFPGHKGLLGPTGTGGLYVREGLTLATIIEGGTGSDSASAEQPGYFPDRLEAGTLNTVGLAGLKAGIAHITKRSIDAIVRKEAMLTSRLAHGLAAIPGITLYGPPPGQPRAAIVTINMEGWDCEELAEALDRHSGIAVRAGLHCAPEAHAAMGTLMTGAVRFSVGPFNTSAEIDSAVAACASYSQQACCAAVG